MAPRLPCDGQHTGVAHGRATVNISQAMGRCQVSRQTVYHWLANGKLQWVRTAGGRVRIFEDSLFVPPPPARA